MKITVTLDTPEVEQDDWDDITSFTIKPGGELVLYQGNDAQRLAVGAYGAGIWLMIKPHADDADKEVDFAERVDGLHETSHGGEKATVQLSFHTPEQAQKFLNDVWDCKLSKWQMEQPQAASRSHFEEFLDLGDLLGNQEVTIGIVDTDVVVFCGSAESANIVAESLNRYQELRRKVREAGKVVAEIAERLNQEEVDLAASLERLRIADSYGIEWGSLLKDPDTDPRMLLDVVAVVRAYLRQEQSHAAS